MPVSYDWDGGSQRYRDRATGRYAAHTEVRSEIDRILAAAASELRQTGIDLQTGKISLAEWQTAVSGYIKSLHLMMSSAGAGGWAQMTQSLYGSVGAELRKQYAWLQKFAEEIEAGLALDNRFLYRLTLYAEAARSTYESTRRKSMIAAGYTHEMRVLHAKESCSGCIEQAAMGWVTIGSGKPIGALECLNKCRCTKEYKKDIPVTA